MQKNVSPGSEQRIQDPGKICRLENEIIQAIEQANTCGYECQPVYCVSAMKIFIPNFQDKPLVHIESQLIDDFEDGMVLPGVHDFETGVQLANGQCPAIGRTYRAFSVINQYDGRERVQDNATFPVCRLPQNSLVNSKKSLLVQTIMTRP